MNDMPGILLLIDFEKAFDNIAWSFIYKTLYFFGLVLQFSNEFLFSILTYHQQLHKIMYYLKFLISKGNAGKVILYHHAFLSFAQKFYR